MASLYVDGSDIGKWQGKHNDALFVAGKGRHHAFESGIVKMLTGWAAYAKVHKFRYESNISEDYFIGAEWFAIGLSFRALLNGERGRLDGGTLDSFILDTLAENGFDITTL